MSPQPVNSQCTLPFRHGIINPWIFHLRYFATQIRSFYFPLKRVEDEAINIARKTQCTPISFEASSCIQISGRPVPSISNSPGFKYPSPNKQPRTKTIVRRGLSLQVPPRRLDYVDILESRSTDVMEPNFAIHNCSAPGRCSIGCGTSLRFRIHFYNLQKLRR